MIRAQSALEFTLISVVMLLFFFGALTAAQRMYDETNTRVIQNQVFEYFRLLDEEFFIAFSLGDGYTRVLNVPTTFSGIPYTLDLYFNQSPQSSDFFVLTIYDVEYLYFLSHELDFHNSSQQVDFRASWNISGGSRIFINST